MDEDALERRYGAPLVAVHRADPQSALLDLADVPVRFGERLVSVDAGGTATFASGARVEADVVIAADGIRPAARAGLLGDGPPRYSGITALHAVVDWGEPVVAGEYWGPRAVFGLVPLPRGQLYWFATPRTPPPVRRGRRTWSNGRAPCARVARAERSAARGAQRGDAGHAGAGPDARARPRGWDRVIERSALERLRALLGQDPHAGHEVGARAGGEALECPAHRLGLP